MRTHKLKTKAPFFSEVWCGAKNFEVREYAEQDGRPARDFTVGDWVDLQEVDSAGKSTGRSMQAVITYILWDHEGYGLKDGWCVLGIDTGGK